MKLIIGSIIVLTLAVLGIMFGSPAYADVPTTPFHQCPSINAFDEDSTIINEGYQPPEGCNSLIVLNADGTNSVYNDTTQWPYEGDDDVLVGVQNNSSTVIQSINIHDAVSNDTGIFAFEPGNLGDGICQGFSLKPLTTFDYIKWTAPAGCSFGPTKYEGPNTSFTIQDVHNGIVTFTNGLKPGASAYFSLETNGIPDHVGPILTITLPPGNTSLTYTGSNTSDYTDPATLSATLTDSNGNPVPYAPINFSLGSQNCTGTTDTSGNASCSITPNEPAGTYPVTASFAGDNTLNGSNTNNNFVVTHEETAIAYTGATTSDYNDSATLSAQVNTDGTPLPGVPVTLSLGSQSCAGTTDSSGNASCSIIPNVSAGVYTVTASFAGDTFYQSSNVSNNFTVTLEETTTSYTGPVNIAQGQPLSAVLKEDGAVAISGRTVMLSLGSGQSCTGKTDTNGNVNCTLSGYPLGSNTITASFAGDSYYKPSTDSKNVLIFAYLTSGSFVLGDQSTVTPITDLTWWGAQWWKVNTLSTGLAPAAFKGFADSVSTPLSCGKPWTTDPGNSSKPPTSIPSYMAVIVSDSISQSGSLISGDSPKIVIVKTDPGYANDPGHAGTGTVVATLCGKK